MRGLKTSRFIVIRIVADPPQTPERLFWRDNMTDQRRIVICFRTRKRVDRMFEKVIQMIIATLFSIHRIYIYLSNGTDLSLQKGKTVLCPRSLPRLMRTGDSHSIETLSIRLMLSGLILLL